MVWLLAIMFWLLFALVSVALAFVFILGAFDPGTTSPHVMHKGDLLHPFRGPVVVATTFVVPLVVVGVLLRRPTVGARAYLAGIAALVFGVVFAVSPRIDTGHRELVSVGDEQYSIPWRYDPRPGRDIYIMVFGPELATRQSAIGSGRRDRIHIDVTTREIVGAVYVEGFGCETSEHRFNCHWPYRNAYILTRSRAEMVPADEDSFKRSVEVLLESWRVKPAP